MDGLDEPLRLPQSARVPDVRTVPQTLGKSEGDPCNSKPYPPPRVLMTRRCASCPQARRSAFATRRFRRPGRLIWGATP